MITNPSTQRAFQRYTQHYTINGVSKDLSVDFAGVNLMGDVAARIDKTLAPVRAGLPDGYRIELIQFAGRQD